MKKLGWHLVDGEDICPGCVQRETARKLTPGGHFTASQLLMFQEAAVNAKCSCKSRPASNVRFLCPICGTWVEIKQKLGIDAYSAECSGCGVSFQKG